MSDSHRTTKSFAGQAIEQWHLAEEIADEAARTDIESHCASLQLEGLTWWDTNQATDNDPAVIRAVTRAVRYLGMRDHIYGHHAHPALVRFR